ncbi:MULTISPECIES: WhiB family transcriptional regulator [Pseudonocardiaceae]|uniref:Transcriptional regulator WhiB n=1 Tax=Haloechinothrix salitolerans TaxID=926830 RepID=A0ABW2C888_9PSEU|nr:WhiB family transcriptional regulator [Allokutzneria sp. A3M-2-11 16]MCP3799760.1 WhiB family transcriptional regulator [Allokutzneria sp. A3M-2-11 16]
MVRLPEWRSRAGCRGRVDLDFIDPAPEQVAECRALCAACPVREQCLAEALAGGEAWGIWGGLDAAERAPLAEQDGHPVPAVLPPHATNSRYAKHGCRCALCREAHTAYERERLRRRRAGDPWVRPIVLAEPMRTGRRWTGAGQYLLPLPGVPAPDQVETGADRLDLVAVAA